MLLLWYAPYKYVLTAAQMYIFARRAAPPVIDDDALVLAWWQLETQEG